MQKLVHADATQVPPLEDPEDEPDDDPDDPVHVPPLHVPPVCVQSTHATPPVPHVESPGGVLWHVFDESQQPVGHDVESQVGLPLLPLAVPLVDPLVDPLAVPLVLPLAVPLALPLALPLPASDNDPEGPIEPESRPAKKLSGPPFAHARPRAPATTRTTPGSTRRE